MNYDTTSLTMSQENYSVQQEVSISNFTLFDKNLHRINKKLKYVNQYYIPKYEQPVENHLNIEGDKDLNKTHNEEINQSLNFYNEFYKLTMQEIESIRKTEVRSILNKRVNTWEHKKRECLNRIRPTDADLMHKIRETLVIDRNYTKDLIDNKDDQLQNRLLEEQIKLDQKTRNIKFALAIKIAISLLEDIKMLNATSQLQDTQIQMFKSFDTNLNQFKNMTRNSNEEDLSALNQLTHNIQVLNEEIVKYISEKPQAKNVTNNDECKNEEIKLSSENEFKENKNEIINFSFKMEENPEVKSDEYFSFKFKADEEKTNDFSNFSFVIEDKNHEEINNIKPYNFENEYRKFLENYLSTQKHLNEIENLYSSFLQDDNFKSLRQELVKSINTPVNSISSVSSWHMKDKFEKLDSLLKCKTVKTGNSTVSANCHKDALIFCKDTLAKKFINIGEQVASVKSETAFEVASIITELWQVHPDFGFLLFSRFKQKCPCLIPYNAAKTNEETDEDYYKSLGYNYINGVVEKQDKYVKRMTGIIRLYASIIVTETKRGKALGIGQAWMIIASTVSLVPQLDMTAILLHEMLAITGFNLKQAYGKQFIKILRYIESKYMKKIDEVTPVGCGGPVQRLKTFISKVIQTGYIDKPKGVIPYNFW